MKFTYQRHLHFYETDAMGIIHHVTYFYLLEEARVAALREGGVLKELPLEVVNYPVLEANMDYRHSIYFEDELTIELSGSTKGARLYFDYVLRTKRFPEPVAFGKTVHVAMDMKSHRPTRLPVPVLKLVND